MKKRIVFFAFIVVLLSGCGKVRDDFDCDFTIKGYVVTAPTNMPLSGVLVRVTNDSYTLASMSSNADGSFAITINRGELYNSYFLSILDSQTDISRQIDIIGVGLSEYNFGNIALYDSRNPYDLPTFEYIGYTYVAHPVLRDKSKSILAEGVCEMLNDFGIFSWFVPSKDELFKFFGSRTIYELPQYPMGYYCIRDSNSQATDSSKFFYIKKMNGEHLNGEQRGWPMFII